MTQHYFTASDSLPAAELQTRRLEIRGKTYSIFTAPQVFSFRGLDLGTRVFLDRVPDPPESGVFVDLGCGWGPLTLALATASPRAQVYGIDINTRARELTQRNAATNSLTNVVVGSPEEGPETIDLLWSNPPMRIGKKALHELLLEWLPRLRKDGCAYLVVQRHLGADSLLNWLNNSGFAAQKIASAKGYRLIRVTHPK